MPPQSPKVKRLSHQKFSSDPFSANRRLERGSPLLMNEGTTFPDYRLSRLKVLSRVYRTLGSSRSLQELPIWWQQLLRPA